MKVLVVTSGYPPEHSGSGLRLHETYSRLQRSRPDLSWSVVTRRRDNGAQVGVPGPDALISIPAPWSPHGAYAPVQAGLEWFALRRQLRRGLLSNVDLVHSAGFTWLTVFLLREARERGIPVIRELTSMTDTGRGTGLGGRLFARVMRALNRSADMLVAISPHLEAEVQGRREETPVWCRPNPVDTNRFHPMSPGERQRARKVLMGPKGWDDDSVLVLHVGRIRSNKNQLLLVKALRRLPDRFKLVLIGPAYETDRPYLDAIHEEIGSATLEARVFIDPRFRTDVETWMGAADVLALPSRQEGLGNVMLEALCSGLPVAATRLPGVTDWIVEPGINGSLFTLVPEDIAKTIASVDDLRPDREKIASHAAERFGASAIDEGYWTRMQTLVKCSGSSEFSV